MSDMSEAGVLYTEHSGLTAMIPEVASLWSYETRSRERDRRSITLNPYGSHEYWLDRSDPLLNTILPGTGVSLVVNLGDMWTDGRSPATSAFLPRVCVVGPRHSGTYPRRGQICPRGRCGPTIDADCRCLRRAGIRPG
jgi:hypothetical protein